MDIEFTIPHLLLRLFGRHGGRSVIGRPSRLQGATRRYATGQSPALDPRASAAWRSGCVGQARGLPSPERAHPAALPVLRTGVSADPQIRQSLTKPLPRNTWRQLLTGGAP